MSTFSPTEAPSTFAIAAGGTGGHFYPALSVAEACRRRGHSVIFLVGGQHVLEHVELAGDRGFEAHAVPSPRLPCSPWHGVLFPWRFADAWWKTRHMLKSLAPDALLGMGSFAAAPACAAALSLRIPLTLHEGNAILGTANRFFARWARHIAVSLPLADSSVAACKIHETGLPLRSRLLEAAHSPPDSFTVRSKYGLDVDKPVLLVFGGSQGAVFLNELLPEAVMQMESGRSRFQIIHLTGSADTVAPLKQAYAGHGITAAVLEREAAMEDCYAAADLVLCRAGAATIAELALYGLPAILVPLPTAAKAHQSINALTLAEEEAAIILDQAPGAAACLAALLDSWIKEPGRWEPRAQAIRRFAHPKAATEVCTLLEDSRTSGKTEKS